MSHVPAGSSVHMRFGRLSISICALISVSLFIPVLHAQDTQEPVVHRTESEFAQITGRSVGALHIYGYADNTQLEFAGIQYVRNSFHRIGPIRVDYMAEVIPVIRLHEPANYNQYAQPIGKQQTTIYGADYVPIGARLFLFPRARVSPFFTGAGGVAYFHSRILSPQATRLNFCAEFGCGLEATLNSRMGLRAGYSVFHLSNGNTGEHNPALDTNFVYAALVYRLHWRGR
jgi:Lipid A 3-O-deacylase (PagL)